MRVSVQPKVYLVARTSLDREGLSSFLRDIGDPRWRPDPAVSDGENLIEAAGRLCYRSWQPYDPEKPDATNPNVSKVREGSESYIGHVLEAGHGSVLEHVTMSFICSGVSRVFTHELVRHRAGMAYSQESLRYVRLDDVSMWLPEAARSSPEARSTFERVAHYLEGVQKELARLFDIDHIKSFGVKKGLTSMFRRLLPIGLATTIMVTGTLRAWRHIIQMRTSQGAEEEIRLVIGAIAGICKREYPNVFQDMHHDPQTGEWTFAHPKV